MQRNWIGRSEGAEVVFDISHLGLEEESLRVFTTRVDTLFRRDLPGAGPGAPHGVGAHRA